MMAVNCQNAAVQRCDEPRFVCDAMLGDLARWLCAWGYDAIFLRDVADWDLIRVAQQQGRILLSSDRGIFQIGWVRDGDLPALFIPPGIHRQQQLELVCQHFRLPRREPHCMRCGGQLHEVAKQDVWERIPPKTRLWLDHFYQCQRCGQLFWEGTHWQQIERHLESLHEKLATTECVTRSSQR
jgi:uncharacterized protein with PIN domain